MITTLISDLNDTLVRGLTGVEETLCQMVDSPKETILERLRDDAMLGFLLGETSKAEYLTKVIRKNQWQIELSELQATARQNFDQVIDSMDGLIERLSREYELVLLSDQGKEWADYVEARHGFLQRFRYRFYSCNYHTRKTNTDFFELALKTIGRKADECLFIDNRERSITVGQKVGLQGILFKNCRQLQEELRRYGVNLPKAIDRGEPA